MMQRASGLVGCQWGLIKKKRRERRKKAEGGAGLAGFTESQNGRGWKGPLWVI